ncbi:MAG: hypothetical protein P857_50 [Candidatus Xenolissoclinum pacificiensis L6]|uniref:Uncharacterized protein n=1 Tax=Candidatus Xenolissoclinum pacificiensis L6 TaxID=1401685 RepID=W2UZA1_9RICK|nr:MAG: hypothetical protein P857_50 [Candidatus Xenolissoclinum pacificiensis L6]
MISSTNIPINSTENALILMILKLNLRNFIFYHVAGIAIKYGKFSITCLIYIYH